MLSKKRTALVEYRVGAKDGVPGDEEKGIKEIPAVPGELVTFKVRRLHYEDALPFNAVMNKAWQCLEGVDTTSTRQARAVAQDEFYKVLPVEQVREAFEKWVSNVTGFEAEDEQTGEMVPVKTGADLYREADRDLVFFVLLAIRKYAQLSATEGKASASPSTSDGAGEANGSSRTVSSANAEGGTEPATAPETSQARP